MEDGAIDFRKLEMVRELEKAMYRPIEWAYTPEFENTVMRDPRLYAAFNLGRRYEREKNEARH